MFDSHAHVADEQFADGRDTVYSRAVTAGVEGWMEVGTSLGGSKLAIAVAQGYSNVVASVGVHPNEINVLTEEDWQALALLTEHEKVKAIGEVGLDFHYGGTAKEQLPALKRFIALANAKHLPIIFHVRSGEDADAHQELLTLLKTHSPDIPKGVIHTFSGTLAQARQYIELGLYLSFSGVLTFKNAGELKEVAKFVPSEKMLIETDCPFLAPVPMRGKRNEPAYVVYVAQALASIRGNSSAEIDQQTVANAKKLFGLS